MTAGVKLGWPFFGLVVLFLLAYGLTHGIFVGSTTEYEASMGGFYSTIVAISIQMAYA